MKALRAITILLFILSLLVYGGVTAYYRYGVDRVSPKIQCDDTVLEVSVTDGEEVLLAGVTASDDQDGDLTDQVMIQGVTRLLTNDTARVTYVVFDASGNMASRTRTIRYTDYQRPRITLDIAPVFAPYPEGDSLTDLDNALKAIDVRDGDISDQVRITAQNVNDSTEGTYRVNVQVTNSLGDVELVPLTIVISSQGAQDQLVQLTEYIAYVEAGSEFDPMRYVSSVRHPEGQTATDPVLDVESDVDTAVPGCYQVRYRYESTAQTYTVYLAVVVR